MYEPPPGHEVVFETSYRGEAAELRFVLESVGVRSKLQSFRGGWLIVVASQDVDQAIDEIASYQDEASEQGTDQHTTIPIYGGAMMLSLIHI